MFGHADETDGFSRVPPRPDFDQVGAQRRRRHWTYWNNHVKEANRGFLEVMGCIHYDRLLAIDEHGDCVNRDPHLLVEFDREDGPFDQQILSIEYGPLHDRHRMRADENNRKKFFPDAIPDEEPSLPDERP